MIVIISPFYNEEQNVLEFFSRFKKEQFYFVCINDGSHDNTLSVLTYGMKSLHLNGKILHYARNVGLERAILGGIINSPKEATHYVVMDTDLQDPPEIIPEMYRMADSSDLVSAYRQERLGDGHMKRHTARLYYSLVSLLIPKNCRTGRDQGNFKLFTKEVAMEFQRRRRFYRSFRLDIYHYSRRPAWIPYSRMPRSAGSTNYTFIDLLREANLSIPMSIKTIFALVSIVLGLLIKSLVVVVTIICWFVYSIAIDYRKRYVEPSSILEI